MNPDQQITPSAQNEPTDDMHPEENNKPFDDEGFDAGIDVDEDKDPKNYIEKLTGKLAQKMRDYNETNQDSDLNKFVINSLIPATIPAMDEEDTSDVIDKVNDNQTEMTNELDTNNEQMQEESIQEPNVEELISELFGRRKKINKNNPFSSPKFK